MTPPAGRFVCAVVDALSVSVRLPLTLMTLPQLSAPLSRSMTCPARSRTTVVTLGT